MFTIILIIFGAIIAGLFVVIAMRPAEFSIARSAKISSPAQAAFEQVNDLRKWESWSPWEKIDPAMRRTFNGPASGTGASYSWEGNKKMGAGRMTIMESRPSEFVRLKLEFLKPFKCTNSVEFTFQPEGNQTTVTWKMSGKNSFIAKAFHLFCNMDKMLGGQFDKGLAQIKSLAEMAGKSKAEVF